jgi:23S rRNA pseudouridine2605 synthase
MSNPVLSKYLAACGVASRRAAAEIVKSGHVTVNGTVCNDPGYRVSPEDSIAVDGNPIAVEKKVWLMLHKPAGYVCSSADPHAEKLAIELVHPLTQVRVFSVGRLDRDSEGLILFTNEGELANQLLHPSHGVRKTYEVSCRGTVTDDRLSELTDGIVDEGERLTAQSVERLSAAPGCTALRITVSEGKKREVRRMCTYLGLRVERLVRTIFGPLTLDRLPSGEARQLTAEELAALRRAPSQ